MGGVEGLTTERYRKTYRNCNNYRTETLTALGVLSSCLGLKGCLYEIF